MSPEDDLVGRIGRFGSLRVQDVFDQRGFAQAVYDILAETGGVYPAAVPDLLAAVPAAVRGEFEAAIRAAARPDFRHRVFVLGQMTPESRRLAEEKLTPRVREWAEAIVRCWDWA